MPYSNYITRDGAQALIPVQDYGPQIIEGAVKDSAVLSLFRRLPNMTSRQAKMPVLDNLPQAYWVTGDTGLKQTTEMAWKNKFIIAEELAVIVPISEAVLDDAAYDIWAEARPRIIEAMGIAIDRAVFFGIDKPLGFRAPLVASTIAAGSVVTQGASLYDTIDSAMSDVEQDGYNVTGLVGGVGLKSAFRRMVDSTGQPLQTSEITSLRRAFIDNGSWDSTAATMLVGDFSQAVYAIRQDVTFKLLDQSVISDAEGKIIFNLAQQDMVALRVVMRLGWEVPNPINALNPNEATRFPFAVVVPSAPSTNTINFTVTDTATEPAPIAGAGITLGGMYKTTGADGKAAFTVPSTPVMMMTYTVNASGYQPFIGALQSDTSTEQAVKMYAGVAGAPIPSGGVGGVTPQSVEIGGLSIDDPQGITNTEPQAPQGTVDMGGLPTGNDAPLG